MANDVYTCGSGETIYGGIVNLPAWRQGVSINEWVAIPQQYTLDSIQPMFNPAINPVYPNKPEFYGGNFGGVVVAWCGACYDDTTGDFMLPLQGGHTDYGGNEPYKVNIFANSVAWQMIRPPTGAIGNTVITQDLQEGTGLYADGRLRAVHSYNYPTAAPGRMFMGALQGQFIVGSSFKHWLVEIDKTTGEYTLIKDYTGIIGGSTYGGSCYDSKRDRVFINGRSFGKLISINLNDGGVNILAPAAERFIGYPRPIYAAEIDKVIIISGPTTSELFQAKSGVTIVDQDSGQTTYPEVAGTAPEWFTWNDTGAVWCGDSVVLWNNSSNTQKVLKLTPTGDPALDPWQLTEVAGTGVVPSVKASTGTFGRLQYSERLGGLILFNNVLQPFYFMRIK